MNKIAIVGDLHLGIAPNNALKFEVLLESQRRFFSECLIPRLESEGIDTIIFTGDLFDQRKRADIKIIQFVESLFENELKKFKCIVIQGNHDTYYKDDLTVTSLSIIWSKPNVTAITKITSMEINGKKFLLVPWLTTALEDYFIENVPKVAGKFDYLVGHFEMLGFPYEAGNISMNGISPHIFYENFKNTISGHFHTCTYKEADGNTIHYVGTPFQMTFGDVGEDKGFWILDLDTNARELVNNTSSSQFIRAYKKEDLDAYSDLSNCFVEFIYSNLTHEELFIIERETLAKNPISFRTFASTAISLSEVMAVNEVDLKVYENMANAINSEDMVSMTRVYVEAEPCENPELVIELINEIRAKISG